MKNTPRTGYISGKHSQSWKATVAALFNSSPSIRLHRANTDNYSYDKATVNKSKDVIKKGEKKKIKNKNLKHLCRNFCKAVGFPKLYTSFNMRNKTVIAYHHVLIWHSSFTVLSWEVRASLHPGKIFHLLVRKVTTQLDISPALIYTEVMVRDDSSGPRK